jgi:replicative DNA helicase
VLGAVLVDNAAFNSAAEVLTRDDFYREAHRRIFDAMAALAERSQAIDLVTLKDELIRGSALEAVGGAAYLASLVDGIPRITNVEQWSRIIKEKAVLRNLIHAGNRIVHSAFEAEEEAGVILDKAEKAIFDIAEHRIRQGFVGIREIVKESFRTIDQLSQSKELVTGLPTGFVDLDEKTSGLQKGDLIIVAARPAMGKTSFCLNVAQYASAKTGETVGIFSLEMAKEQLVLRMLCADARVDAHRLRTGNLQEKDWARLAKAYADLSASKIFIDDSATLTPLEMRAKCRRLMAEHGLGLIVVDYLQLVSGSGRTENRQQEIASISRSLKGLAKELSVPVVALSQLSRAPETRTEKRPQLSDLRECVTGETLVVMADGQRLPIRDLVGTAPEVVAMSSPEGWLTTARSDKVWRVGKRPVYRVKLASGRTIRATLRHRLWGPEGWTRLRRLAVGDRVGIARRLAEPAQPDIWPDQRVALLGQRSHQKRIPVAAFRLSNRQIALLLRHLWATDGTMSLCWGHRGGHSVYYSTNSPGLASDVAALLLRMGIVARTYWSRKANYRPNAFVNVSSGADQLRFLEVVGAFGPRVVPAEELQVAIGGSPVNTNVDTLPVQYLTRVAGLMLDRGISARAMSAIRGVKVGGPSAFVRFSPSRHLAAEYGRILQDGILMEQATNDLFWDRIVAIEPDGEEDVYDLTVPGPSSWLADGIVSHNSGGIEADADIVIFIYREEEYKATDENRGVAEIIIGKQRNGPTGMLKLAFIKEFTRFENLEWRNQ